MHAQPKPAALALPRLAAEEVGEVRGLGLMQQGGEAQGQQR